MYKHLGFGIMRINDEPSALETAEKAIDIYMQGDFCYFDLHPNYCNGKSQSIFKKYVSDKYPRKRFLVANKMPYYGINAYEDYERVFAEELKACGVDYFDYYLLHCINDDNYIYHQQYDGFSFLEALKEKESVKKIGISFHGKPELLDEVLSRYRYLDFVQLQINFCDWNSATINSRECYKVARGYNKEILVMEPIKGGMLAKSMQINSKQYTAADMADLALRFFVDLDGISIILSGMTNPTQVMRNRNSLKKAKGDTDYEELVSGINSEYIIPCTKCKYCENECKSEIKISNILAYINEAATISEGVSRRNFAELFYRSQIEKEHRASKCISCGQCEKRCPQHLPISFFMKCAKDIFELEKEKQDEGWHAIEKIAFWNISMNSRQVMNDSIPYKIYCYGAGKCFKENAEAILRYGKIEAVIDGDEEKKGSLFNGIKCIDVSDVSDFKDSFVIITLEKVEIAGNIAALLLEQGVDKVDVLWNWLDYANLYKWNRL